MNGPFSIAMLNYQRVEEDALGFSDFLGFTMGFTLCF